MDKLTPTARLTLESMQTGPGNVHELCERTGRSRSATDKAIGELAKANLIVKVDDGGDPADGAPARWQLADPAPADGEPAQPEPASDDSPAQPAADQPGTAEDAATDIEATEAAPADGADNPAADAQPTDQAPVAVSEDLPADEAQTDAAPAVDGQPGGETKPDGDGDQAAEAEQPKLCRGCQAQMPKICECCWQNTPAYCGKCRKTMPQMRRGEPGEPQILSNGLPKLRPGELEAMVEKVLREHPVPHHIGVTGWTAGRVAVFLPGRSTGAIGNALRKLTTTGVAELIGDNPERYQLKGANATDTDQNTDASQSEAGQPPTTDATATDGGTTPENEVTA